MRRSLMHDSTAWPRFHGHTTAYHALVKYWRYGLCNDF